MSRSYTFVAKEHEEYGTFGWKPEWMEDGDPYSGMAVAHDILSHPPCRVADGVAGEFMALGADYLIRGTTGWFADGRGDPNPIHNLASEIPDILWRVRSGAQTFRRAPPTKRLDDDVEDEFEAIFTEAIAIAKDGFDPFHPCAGAETTSELVWFRGQRSGVLDWVRRGYRYAAHRYRHTSPYRVSCLFTEIMHEADAYLPANVRRDHRVAPPRAPSWVGELYGGEKLVITPNLKKLTFTAKFLSLHDQHPDDYDY